MKKLILFLAGFLAAYGYGTALAHENPGNQKVNTVVQQPLAQTDSVVPLTHGKYVFVDMGLPSGVQWAAHNVGAQTPEEYGTYFLWAEIPTPSSANVTKSPVSGKPMNDISGNPQYDAATASWGVPARMPTKAEIDELVKYCETTWVTQNGVNGRLVKSKANGNSIFFPAGGRGINSSFFGVGNIGYYWSSSPNGDQNAYGLDFASARFYPIWCNRNHKMLVRPVRSK